MTELAAEPLDAVVEIHGVALQLTVSDPELAARMLAALPPGCLDVDTGASPLARLALTGTPATGCDLEDNDRPLLTAADPEVALAVLAERVHALVARNAAPEIFVRGAAVACDGRAIALPGPVLSGRSTLVRALVERGCVAYSEEFVVLGADGRLLPYPGSPELPSPIPVGLIAVAPYRTGASWLPERRTPADGALALFERLATVREQAGEQLPALRAAAAGAVVLAGERGEAGPAASALIDAMTQAA